MMSDSNVKSVAIYTRVSTEDQAKEGFSLEAQIRRLRAYCESRGWDVFKEYVDGGFSGRNIKRPMYKQMLHDMDHWDGILVLKMDRIHRNSKNFMKMMDDLQRHRKEFISTMESLDTSNAMGRFVMDIIQRIAQLESEQTGERTFYGMRQKARDLTNGIVGHQLPYGFELKDGNVIKIPDEIENVRRIYDLYIMGLSTRKIANEIKISYNIVRNVLRNTTYTGLYHWNNEFRVNSDFKVITLDQWNQVQVRKRNSSFTGEDRSKCPGCGSSDRLKRGMRKLVDGSKKQRWECKDCGRKYVEAPQVSCGMSARYKPFIIDELKNFNLTYEEMDKYGLWNSPSRSSKHFVK